MTPRLRLTLMSALASLLGAVVLRPIFHTVGYLAPALGAIVVVAVVGELCRRLAVPALVTPLVALVASIGYLTAVFAHSEAVLGVIPGAAARARLRQLVEQGQADIAALAPPLPSHSGVVLLTTAGIAAVALLVDLLAVGLRRAAVAGLPLFALYVVPAAVVPKGIGVVPFVIGASGYLALLVADGRERLGRWGRPLGAGRRELGTPPLQAELAETSPLARVGRRIAAASIGAAVILPGLVPGLGAGTFGVHGKGDGGHGGSSSVTAINPIVTLKRQLVEQSSQRILSYRSDDSSPPYLRLTTLDQFNGLQWSQRTLTAGEDHRVSRGVPQPLGLTLPVASSPVSFDVRTEASFQVPWLPTPYPLVRVAVQGDWRYDDSTRTVWSSRTDTSGLEYVADGLELAPTPEQLRTATVALADPRDLELPPLPPAVEQLAAEVTAGAHSPYEQAVLLQAFFHREFQYDLATPSGNGTNELADFLLTSRRGYCEQFAAAMAVLARQLGIPARVNIGFTPGSPSGDRRVVTGADAHAWPELWFDGVGWLAFEPTPRADQVRQPAYSVAQGRPSPEATPTASASATPTAAPTSKARSALEDAQPDVAFGTQHRGRSALVTGLALILLVALLGLLLPLTARRLVRRRRWESAETEASAAHAAWAELRDSSGDLGFGWSLTETPRATAARLAALVGDDTAAAAARRLGRAQERARYARWIEAGPASAAASAELRADVDLVVKALAARCRRRTTVAALLLPRSVLRAALHAATGFVADVLDGIDAALAAVGRLLRRAVPGARSEPAG